MRRLWLPCLALGVSLVVGCGEDPNPIFGPSTDATCPPTSTVTYANFGQGFMTQYCTRCHAATLAGPDRMGAPQFHDFDTLDGIRPVTEHIDQVSGSGPAATNESMPPDGARPTLEERAKLAEWIACDTP